MTYDDLQRALAETRDLLGGLIEPKANPAAVTDDEQRQHCAWMLDEAACWPPERREKAMRWLCFVQGWLWAFRLASVEQFKAANRPADKT